MAKHQWKGRRLRLRRELRVIGGAVEAARILGEALATQQLGPERDHSRAPRAITSLLTMVERRLREVRRRCRSGVDPQRGVEPRRERARRRDGWAQLTHDERMLAWVSMRQRAGGAARRAAPMP